MCGGFFLSPHMFRPVWKHWKLASATPHIFALTPNAVVTVPLYLLQDLLC